MKKRILSLLLTAAMLTTFMSPAALAAERILHINSAQDLRDLAEKCILDSYSIGLTVILDENINLSQHEFNPIPSFSGSFQGGGHSITGFTLATDGSHQGLFRYLLSDGSISDLSVEGNVEPDNSRSQVGGLVGSNYGAVSNCDFSGTVSGLNYVGGIAGENYGTISGCSVDGTISGKRFTGGIAGYNEGLVDSCFGDASVNTTVAVGGLELDSLTLNTLTGSSLTGAEDTDVVSDSGGIVGFSVGVIQNCENRGNVGYPHYGYNVGGIAGRQSGYVFSCVNRGDICGRQDVAGIVGQMEPYLQLKDSASLADEVALLQAMISSSLANLDGISMEMESALYSMSMNAGNAMEDFYIDSPSTPGDSDDTTGGSGDATGGSGDTTGGSGDATGGSGDATGGSGDATGGSGNTGTGTGLSVKAADADGNPLPYTVTQGKSTNLSSIKHIRPSAARLSAIDPSNPAQSVEDIINNNKDNSALKEDISLMGDDMDRFTTALGNVSQTLTGDLSGISAQMAAVMLMLVNAISGAPELNLYEDVSEREPEDSIQGKVFQCENHGVIDGDTNIGGIAGDMGIEYAFDLENEIMSYFTSKDIITSTYETKCVARSNKNYGTVYAKKDHAGSVIGQTQIGIVDKCEGYGNVSSSEGGYVGGVVGNSLTTVTNSCAMCEVYGKEFVGGIVGYGTKVQDCASLVGIQNVTACCGAIAGWADMSDKESVSGNTYVSNSLGAVDGISYSGYAEAVSYRSLMSNDALPEEFGVLKLRFVADGVLVAELPFEYGGSIPFSQLPAVPQKEGFTGKWEDYDYTGLYYGDEIDAIYSINQAALSADVFRDDSPLPIVLAEGNFSGRSRLRISDYNGEAPDVKLGRTVEMLTLTIENDGQDKNYSIHYLEPKHSTKLSQIQLYGLSDGAWVRLPTTVNGSYLVFSFEGDSISFCALETEDKAVTTLIYVAGGLALAAALVFVSRGAKRRKAAKAKAGQAEDGQT